MQFTGLDTSANPPKRKKVAFHVNQFSIRGTEVAIYDYACYNEILLGNDSVFIAPESHKYRVHPTTGPTHSQCIEDKFRKTFQILEYAGGSGYLDQILKDEKCDVVRYTRNKVDRYVLFNDWYELITLQSIIAGSGCRITVIPFDRNKIRL